VMSMLNCNNSSRSCTIIYVLYLGQMSTMEKTKNAKKEGNALAPKRNLLNI